MDSPKVTPAFSSTLKSETPSKLTGGEPCSEAVSLRKTFEICATQDLFSSTGLHD
jgi:hypothetical protein